jgi:hypothetical protein
MSAVMDELLIAAPKGADQADVYASLAVRLVHLVGGRIETWAFEPCALVLAREGAFDSDGVSFGCDYDLNIRSRELRRGYVRAVDTGRLVANGREICLGRRPTAAELPSDDAYEEAVAIARSVVDLPRDELERRARHLLLAE